MQVLSGHKLLTCRYWVFGPGCPNVDADGAGTCQYAHWDTGRLSSFYQQRGTCWYWAHPTLKCHFGAICIFEHRETGFMGTHHGILELSDLNLHIADAATNSGFDTRNHIALFDLIWSVRRVAFNYGLTQPRLKPPQKHLMYPNRYRPGAQGKKSKKSRKRAREGEAQGHGTSSHPIALDADGSENEDRVLIHTGSKRQKTGTGLILNHTARKPPGGLLNPVHPSHFPNQRLRIVKAEGKENVPPGRTTFMPPPRSLNLPPPRDSPSSQNFHALALFPGSSGRQCEPVRSRNPLQALKRQQETLYELGRVSQTLSDNLDTVRKCQHIIRTLYNADDRVRHPDIFDMLVKLRNDMEESNKGNQNALGDVNHVIAFLKSRDRDIAGGIDGTD